MFGGNSCLVAHSFKLQNDPKGMIDCGDLVEELDELLDQYNKVRNLFCRIAKLFRKESFFQLSKDIAKDIRLKQEILKQAEAARFKYVEALRLRVHNNTNAHS